MTVNSCFLTALATVLAAATGGLVAAEPRAPDAAVRQGPQLLSPGEHGVGGFIPNVSFADLSGQTHQLAEFKSNRAVVVALTSTSCPLSKKYLPALAELAKTYAERGVQFILVNPTTTDKLADMQAAQALLGPAALYVWDQKQSFTKAVGALSTTDVLVLNPSRTVTYHGAIDDQYGLGYSLAAPRQRYLADALEAILENREVLVSATSAPGCVLGLETKALQADELTYYGPISRLLQRNCVECHRDGGVAPFALETYDEVSAHAAMIRQVVERRIMPPWFAAAEGPHSPWINDRSLSPTETQMLLSWLDGGKRAGDPADAPQPRSFPDGWLIGKPDAVFAFEKPVPVKATGTMPYQNVVVETNLTEDKWVQAIEVRPGDVGVVHHVLVFVKAADEKEQESSRRDATADERMGYWGLYVPGNSTLIYPPGYAKRLPKGAKLRFQMHYTPNGTATEDRTRIGVVFAKEPPQHEIRVAAIVNPGLNIPPGADNHREVATLRLPTDVEVLAFLPHMHLRGKAARYDVVSAGETKTLLDIPQYDFNWQLLYRYAKPLPLKRGDALQFTAWYDNSAQNPANPDPTRTVRWGPQTYDEMHLGYVEYLVPGQKPDDAGEKGRGSLIADALRETAAHALFRQLDVNGDGLITRSEVRERMPDNPNASGAIFDHVDADGSGALDVSEFSRLKNLPRR